MSDFSNRLKSAMAESHTSRYMLAKKCSISPSTVTNWIMGKTIPDKSKIKIVSNYLDVSEEWLLTGKGVPRDYRAYEPSEEELKIWEEESAVESAIEIVGDNDLDLISKISKLPMEDVKRIKDNIEARLQENIDWLPKVETRPRVPITAAAGSLSGDNASVTLKECEQIPVISQMPSYDYTIVIKGDSMMPKYESGDEVACRRIDQTRFIQWGKVHVLDTTQGIIIKRIYEEGDCIKCVSFNPDYPPFLIPKSDIYSMGLVVGSLSITEI